MSQDRTNEETMIIKVKNTNHVETAARKVAVNKSIRFEELEYKLRERFNVDYDKSVEIYYLDEDNDRIAVSFEDELALALDGSQIRVFEIVVKPKIVNSISTYPHVPKGKAGDCVEVLVESQHLTLTNAKRNDTKAWGTYAYTGDSDIVKVLAHLEKLDLSDDPPLYNVIVTLRYIPGNLSYIGTTTQGSTTLNYGPYDISYIVKNVRTVPIPHEKQA